MCSGISADEDEEAAARKAMNTLLFIVGCPRSGTTWAGDVFRQHPQAVVSMESALLDCLRTPWWKTWSELAPPHPEAGSPLGRKAWQLLWTGLEKLLVRRTPPWHGEWRDTLLAYFGDHAAFVLHHAGLWRKPTLTSMLMGRLISYGELRELIGEVEQTGEGAGLDHEAKVAHLVRAIFQRALERHGGGPEHVFVEKSPSHLFHAEFILDRLPEARVLEMVRDGRDVCVSMDSYQPYMPKDRDVQIRTWKGCVERGLALAAKPAYRGRLLRVRYEDLRSDRRAEIGRMLDFAGLATSDEQLREIVEETHISRKPTSEDGHYRKGAVGDWRGRFSRQDTELFHDMAGDALARLGYEE